MASPERRPFVSVIIPHLNQPEAARSCLASLARQSWLAADFEVILVDNGSTRLPEELRETWPGLVLLEERTPGPGPARNRGVAAARGEILAFIDADCLAHPGWIAAAVAALAQPESRGVAGGDVRIALSGPAGMTPLEAYESVFAYRQREYIEKMGFSGTGNLAMRRDVFAAVGPFGGIGVAEDRDWGRRALSMGYAARYAPDMVIFHPARQSLEELREKWRRHVAHDRTDHIAAGKGVAGWGVQMVKVALSPFVHALAVLRSNRLSGMGNRLKAIRVLFAIRWFRVAEMARAWRRGDNHAAAGWNRRQAK